MESIKHIEGSEKVKKALGFWPSFHDAEVISFSVSRALPIDTNICFAKLVVHVQQYAEVGVGTAEYALTLIKSVLVNFIFNGVSDLSISEFNHQNVINSIKFKITEPHGSPGIYVEIESIWGFGGSLQCNNAAIESVEELPIV
ncbi:Imm50 family immunity protein [Pseudomonas peli]|uniref:Imm50 family immunity protein n=1 Tax=Pseudomonas peli TaxID=592361 RepID=UPI002ABBD9D2|nr:Imm50 family immunity protein [Pseudomonas sp.]